MDNPIQDYINSLQDCTNSLPGCECSTMVQVRVNVTRVSTEVIDLCVPVPDSVDELKYVETVMSLALPLLPREAVVSEVQSITPTWDIIG